MNKITGQRFDTYFDAECHADRWAGDNPGLTAWVVEIYPEPGATLGTLYVIGGMNATGVELTDFTNAFASHSDWDRQYETRAEP